MYCEKFSVSNKNRIHTLPDINIKHETFNKNIKTQKFVLIFETLRQLSHYFMIGDLIIYSSNRFNRKMVDSVVFWK